MLNRDDLIYFGDYSLWDRTMLMLNLRKIASIMETEIVRPYNVNA